MWTEEVIEKDKQLCIPDKPLTQSFDVLATNNEMHWHATNSIVKPFWQQVQNKGLTTSIKSNHVNNEMLLLMEKWINTHYDLLYL